MPRKDASFIKNIRLQEICKQIKFNIKDGVNYEKLLDWIEYNIGLTREKAREYINLILKVNGWVLDGETIKAEL